MIILQGNGDFFSMSVIMNHGCKIFFFFNSVILIFKNFF